MNMLPITRPNLSETQDRLRMLPRSGPYLQKTIQYLTAAAQGQIPSVEPYIALGELNNIKQDMEKQQSMQQSAGANQPPLSQTLPQEAKQAAGIASLMGGRQQQGMQQMAQAAQRMPQPVPDNVDGVGIMSGGGSPKGFGSGGIIAFADGEKVEADDDDDEDDGSAVSPEEITASRDAAIARLQALQGKPTPARVAMPDQAAIRQGILANASPEVRALMGQDIGSNVAGRMHELKQAREAEIAKKREDEARLKKIDFWNSVFEGTEASRGQQGAANLGAFFGGFGRSLGRSEKAAIEREQALREGSLNLQATQNEVLNKIDELRRAKVEGDVEKQMRLSSEIAKLNANLDVATQKRVSSEVNALLGYTGKVDSASIAAAARRNAAKLASQRDQKFNEQFAAAAIRLVEAQESGDPEKVAAAQRRLAALKGVSKDIHNTDPALARIEAMLSGQQVTQATETEKRMATWRTTNPQYLAAIAKNDFEEADRLEAEAEAKIAKRYPNRGRAAPAPAVRNPASAGNNQAVMDEADKILAGKK